MRILSILFFYSVLSCDHQKTKSDQNRSGEMSATSCTSYDSVKEIIEVNCIECHSANQDSIFNFENLADSKYYFELSEKIMGLVDTPEKTPPHKALAEITVKKLSSWKSQNYPRTTKDCDDLQQTMKKLRAK
jgi:hypothetical protein